MNFTSDLRCVHVLVGAMTAPSGRGPIVAPEQVDILASMLEIAGAAFAFSGHAGHELGT